MFLSLPFLPHFICNNFQIEKDKKAQFDEIKRAF